MANFNKVIFLGRMTRDVELRFLPDGRAVGAFGMAANRSWKTETGEKREEVVFVDFSTFGKQAETLGQYVRKGDLLMVEGRLKLDQWEDRGTGEKRSKLKVVVEGFQFMPNGERRDPASQSEARPRAKAPAATSGAGEAPAIEDDDVPF